MTEQAPLINEITEAMKCPECGELKAVYADGIACMNGHGSVLPFANIVVEELTHEDGKVVVSRLGGRETKPESADNSPSKLLRTMACTLQYRLRGESLSSEP